MNDTASGVAVEMESATLLKNLVWNSEQVERIIADSQEVIGPVKAKAGIEVDLA